MVKFRFPVEVPGFGAIGVTFLETGATRLVEGRDTITPQSFLNHELRCITISGRDFPLEQVAWWERAPAAVNTSKLTPVPGPDHTIGRRAKQ